MAGCLVLPLARPASASFQDEKPGEAQSGDIPPMNEDKPIPEGCWFKKIHISFGKQTESTEPIRLKGEYEFENKSGADQEITLLTSSCKCQELELFVNGEKQSLEKKLDVQQSLKEPIKVPKDASGTIKLVFDVSGPAGQRSGFIQVNTTDAKMPTFNLTVDAAIDAAFLVEPPIVDLGKMSPVEAKPWSVKVRCMLDGAWELSEKPLDPITPGMSIQSVDVGTDERGKFYEIKGVYGPNLDEGALGGNLLFKTNRDGRNVLVGVRAEVKSKVHLTPGFFSLNRFKRADGCEDTVYIWPNDIANEEIAVDHVEVVESNYKEGGIEYEVVPPTPLDPAKGVVEVEIPRRTEGGIPAHKLWRIRVHVKPGLELEGVARRLSSTIKVHFKGDGMVPKTVRFNGFPY
ncbi:MAG: DUF1573 domain-containing protein [Planctomycetes bacterium]|nr:DUF1573 domain-containing protein [Planctomycetota bacterium]